MSNAREIVEEFLRAFYGGDRDTARSHLADDFSFAGPSATFTGADSYLKAAAHVAHGVRSVVTHKLFIDGDDVCAIYDLMLEHRVERLPVAEWFHLEGGKIVSSRMFFDTAPFTANTASAPEATAIDPVCGMEVDRSAPAATRSHAGATYYFCSPGCAVAFEREPETYLAAASHQSDNR